VGGQVRSTGTFLLHAKDGKLETLRQAISQTKKRGREIEKVLRSLSGGGGSARGNGGGGGGGFPGKEAKSSLPPWGGGAYTNCAVNAWRMA